MSLWDCQTKAIPGPSSNNIKIPLQQPKDTTITLKKDTTKQKYQLLTRFGTRILKIAYPEN